MQRHHRLAVWGSVLSTLGRREFSGELVVESLSRRARACIVSGRLQAVRGVGIAPLGDVLLEEGLIDRGAHLAWLEQQGEPGPSGSTRMGEAWVQAGILSTSDLAFGLRVQVRRRVAALLDWPEPTLRLEPFSVPGRAPERFEGERVGSVFARAFRAALAQADPAALRSELAWGSFCADGGPSSALLPLEVAVRGEWTRSGGGIDGVESAFGEEGIRAAHLLMLLREVRRARPARSYSFVMRKQRELRRGAPMHRVLGVAKDAGAPEVRRALRAAALRAHPDLFAQDDASAIEHATKEVMAGLLRAERAIAK